MKKMLLATTALAAVSVTPAIAVADVTLSAYYEFGWAQHSDDTEGDDDGNDSHTFNDTEVHIKFETTSDSGLNYGAVFELEGAADGTQSVDQDTTSVSTKVMDEASVYFKGDFGKLTLGQNDFAHDSFLTWTPTHRGTISQDDGHYSPRFASGSGSNNGVTLASVDTIADLGTGVGSAYFGPNASYNDSEKVTYMSPNLGGFTFGISWMDSNTAESTIPSFGLKYSGGMGMMDDGMMGGIGYTITANSFDNGADGDANTTSNQYGITLTSGNLTLTASQSSIEGAGGVGSLIINPDADGDGTADDPVLVESSLREVSTQEFGVGYKVSDALSVGASMTSSKDDVSQHETDVTSFSGQYTITSGLSATAALNNYEVVDNYWNRANDGSTIVLTIQANF